MKMKLMPFRGAKRRRNLKRRLHEETIPNYPAKQSKIATRPAARNDLGAVFELIVQVK